MRQKSNYNFTKPLLTRDVPGRLRLDPRGQRELLDRKTEFCRKRIEAYLKGKN